MSENIPNAGISARQVGLAVNRLESLATLPCVAAQYITKFTKSELRPSTLSDLIESDPALTARMFSLMSSHGLRISEKRFSMGNAIDKLPANEVRDAILSIRVAAVSENTEQTPDRNALLIHSLACACYARALAELISAQIDPHMAYFAGLLHDLGKFALIDIMPRSFYRMIEQARSEKQTSRVIEQKHIGTDHTLIGKRLSEKWQLPEAMTLSIWLHHSVTAHVLQEMPEARVAAIVQVADNLAVQAEIGNSGSFHKPEAAEPLASELGISPEQLARIHQRVRDEVKKKTDLLGLDVPEPLRKYLEALQAATVQLSKRDNEHSDEIRKLQSISGHFSFIKDFLLSIRPGASALDIAENFAARWQKFFQTGKVCLYLLPPADSRTIEAAVVESLSQSEVVLLEAPLDTRVMPKNIAGDFAIIDANDHIKWLSDQMEAEFDARHTKLAPLLFGSGAIGVIAFELHYPGDVTLFEDKFRVSALVGGMVLAQALDKRKEENFAERLSVLLSSVMPAAPEIPEREEVPPEREEISVGYSLAALAELAAGAAHELNNPLAVISGRAQLLAEAEQNQESRQILQQIQQNANEASEIIEDLMSFAEPPSPRPARTSVSQIIEEALQLASRKAKVETINAEVEKADNLQSPFIDSAQVVSAIANIICNAVESYAAPGGSVKIIAQPAESDDFIKLLVEDHGRGMAGETLKKAAQPFFSAKPAGRKRGIGLAYAARLIQLNKGSLSIASEPGKGTTVSIYLPYK